MAEKRITKRDNFLRLREIVMGITELESDPLVQFIDRELELLSRKHNATPNPKREADKNTAKQEICFAIKGGFHRASAIATCAGMSVQRASALLKQLVAEGEVTRRKEGKVVEFYLN